MIKYTKHTLKKVEELFNSIKYTIRYERGNFQSGYCIVENKRIAVINKFYDAEARINCLIEILGNVEVDPETLEEKEQKLYEQLTAVFNAKEKDDGAEVTEAQNEKAVNDETAEQEKETPEVTSENQ
jgi:hypothetical protein